MTRIVEYDSGQAKLLANNRAIVAYHTQLLCFRMVINFRPITAVALFLSLATLTTACSTTTAASNATQSLSPQEQNQLALLEESQLYRRAREALDVDGLETALAFYDALETRFPFSDTTRQAQLERAFVYYKLFNNEAALTAANRFVTQYPRHENVDYGYYLKGLVNFRRAGKGEGSWYKADQTLRDPSAAREAFFSFSRLVNSYPNSVYAADSRKRMIYLRDRLARHQWHIIEYYQRKNAWVAVASRSKQVLAEYQGSSYTNKALGALVEAYTELGLTELAADARAALEANQAGSIAAATQTTPTAPTVVEQPAAEPVTEPDAEEDDEPSFMEPGPPLKFSTSIDS